MDGPQAPPIQDPDARDKRLSACLREYHARRSSGEPVKAEEFAERLSATELELFRTLIDMDTLLEDPEPTVNDAAMPRIFGDYTLLREVGNGATGVVYEAIEHGLRRSVAIKVLKATFGEDETVRERFLREADACSQIDHPNVVTVHRSGEAEGHPYYAMSFVDGLPLNKMLGTNQIDVRDVCRRAAEVADALGVIHEAGIVHRDVKPGNIMQAPDGKWILTDFGHVHNDAALTLTKSGDALGTPLYMSPEQARGTRSIDGRTDVYALGATLYHLLTGAPVFAADDVQGLMRAILMDRAESMRGRMIEVPPDLDRVVLKCLEKRPEDRYQTMDELAADLRAVAEGRSVQGRPVTRLQRVLRWIPQHPIRIAAGVLIALGFAWLLLRTETPTLMVDTMSGARIAVRGAGEHEAPLVAAIPLEIGDNQFTVSLEGFRTRTVNLEAGSGEKHNYNRFALAPEDPDDLQAQHTLLAFLGVVQANAPTMFAKELLEPTSVQRDASLTRAAGGDLTTVAVYPRGKITVDELDRYLVSAGDEFDEAEIVWVRGDQEITRTVFDPEYEVEEGTIPDAVREQIQVGDTLRWSIVSGRKTIAEAQAQVVEATADDLPVLDSDDMPSLSETERRTVRAHALLQQGFLTRAARTADQGKSPTSLSLAKIRRAAVRGLCEADGKRLHDARVWHDASAALEHLRAAKPK